MKPRTNEKDKARELRQSGYSVTAISHQLGISKGSISPWVKDIVLTEEQELELKKNERENRIRFKNFSGYEQSQKNKSESITRLKEYREKGFELAKIDNEFSIVCALYWAEGNKTKNTFRISNCDYTMLSIIKDKLIKMGYELKKMGMVIHCVEDTETKDNDIKDFWQEKVGIEKIRVYRYKVKNESQRKGFGKQPFGTAHMHVFNTELLHMVYGGIDYLRR